MQPYPIYKPSHIDWIGEIPSHWGVKKLKYFAQIMNGKDYQEFVLEDGGYPVYGSGGAFARCSKFLHDKPSVLLGRKGSVSNPQFVIGPFWTSDTTYYTDIKSDVEPMFLFHLVKQIQFDLYIYGSAVPSMTKSVYDDMMFPYPPLPEQQAIVKYLDQKTTLIDELIAKKTQHIALLQEQRTALINHAVTKGLNADVDFKDSKIEWIGEIPEHWRVKKLKYLIKDLESGVSVNSIDTPVISRTEIGVLKTSCVYSYSFNSEENKKVVDEDIDRVKCSVKANSIIISRMNTPDLVGACGFVDSDIDNLFLPDRLWQTVFFSLQIVNARWLYNVLICSRFREVLSFLATGTSSSMKNITKDDFLNIVIPFPPISEQQAIVAYLDEQTALIDKGIAVETQYIASLKEYRQSLISAVVTGKICII